MSSLLCHVLSSSEVVMSWQPMLICFILWELNGTITLYLTLSFDNSPIKPQSWNSTLVVSHFSFYVQGSQKVLLSCESIDLTVWRNAISLEPCSPNLNLKIPAVVFTTKASISIATTAFYVWKCYDCVGVTILQIPYTYSTLLLLLTHQASGTVHVFLTCETYKKNGNVKITCCCNYMLHFKKKSSSGISVF